MPAKKPTSRSRPTTDIRGDKSKRVEDRRGLQSALPPIFQPTPATKKGTSPAKTAANKARNPQLFPGTPAKRPRPAPPPAGPAGMQDAARQKAFREHPPKTGAQWNKDDTIWAGDRWRASSRGGPSDLTEPKPGRSVGYKPVRKSAPKKK